jgi:nitrogenase molybdenum-iron protein beta chain
LLEHLPAVIETGAEPASAVDVNLFGLVPALDASWEGDLLEIEAVLGELGLVSSRLLGYGQGVAAWQGAAGARLSLVLSPWGAEAAAWLHQNHAVPTLDLGWLPVGSLDSGLLLERVGHALGIAAESVAAARSRLDARLRHALRSASAQGLLGDIQRRVAVVGGSAGAVGQARFLAGTLGMLVEQVVITDLPPEDRRAALVAAVKEVAGESAEVSFLSSRHAIDVLLRDSAPELIVGSALEESTARAIGAAHVEAAAPIRRRPVIGRSFAGVRGAVTLLEEILAALHAATVTVPAEASVHASVR